MWSLFSDFARRPHQTYTVVVMEADGVEESRQYAVRPIRMAWWWAGSIAVAMALATALVAFTPIRTLIPGYGTEQMRQQARLNTLRVTALQDSVRIQKKYIQRMQDLLTGRVRPDEGTPTASRSRPPTTAAPPEEERPPARPPAEGSEDHVQPALATPRFPARAQGSRTMDGGGLASLLLPAAPPVENGFPTRGFDARSGHYAVDIAIAEGALVHSIGDGYIVMADWTQDGGYTIAVQHADGYLSVYKHNKRLLKRVGERVRTNEAIAVSGNTGEITTGPHLHFELWHHGLAQDPRSYIVGW